MKKTTIIFLFTAFLIHGALCQSALKGSKSGFIGLGVSKLGFYSKIGAAINTGKKTLIHADLMGEYGKIHNFKFSTVNITGIFYYTPVSIRNKVFFSGGLGLTANFSSIKDLKVDENGYTSNLRQYDYGLAAGLLIESYLSKRISLFVNADQRWWFLSRNLGNGAWYAGPGIKVRF